MLINDRSLHEKFISSDRKHILMITNHGVHRWNVIAGMPDTGGQNVFVNQFTQQFAESGYKVTIANRGGFVPPGEKQKHSGLRYKNDSERILYLEDSQKKFIRKEDMDSHTVELAVFLYEYMKTENNFPALIISHYWDGAKVGILFNENLGLPHVWVPHSLGTVKKNNMDPSAWKVLRVDERIEIEKQIVGQVDEIVHTSSMIKKSLEEDYGVPKSIFFPPCIDSRRFKPAEVKDDDPVWSELSRNSGLDQKEIRSCRIITEVSRTDRTKRKGILIEAFALLSKKHEDIFLAVTVDTENTQLGQKLLKKAEKLGVRKNIAFLGSIWNLLPSLYSASYLYCTPSVMEGFGMSIQEAAACGIPAVSSDLVPFACEYLCGDDYSTVKLENGSILKQGPGAFITRSDDIEGIAGSIDILLSNPELRDEMGKKALEITIPYFTWTKMCESLLEKISF